MDPPLFFHVDEQLPHAHVLQLHRGVAGVQGNARVTHTARDTDQFLPDLDEFKLRQALADNLNSPPDAHPPAGRLQACAINIDRKSQIILQITANPSKRGFPTSERSTHAGAMRFRLRALGRKIFKPTK